MKILDNSTASIRRGAVVIPAWIGLALIGGVMAAIWYFTFGGRYPLSRYGDLPQQSLATLNGNSLDSAILYSLATAGLFLLYWLGARWIKEAGRAGWLVLIGGALAMNAALLPMHTMDAADIYDYIIRGRMTAFYNLNPMQDTPERVPAGDNILPFAAWKDATSAYGPAWETIAALTVRIAGPDRDTNVVVFKLLSCLGYALTAALIAWALRALAPERAMLGAYLFAWNPLMVYFAGGTGHNDMLMVAAMALSVGCLLRRWYVPAAAAAVVGALIKFIPLLLIPIIAIKIWHDLPWRGRIVTYAALAVTGAALVLIFYAPYWVGFDSLALDRRGRMFTSSAGTLVRQALRPLVGDDSAISLVSRGATALFGLYALWELWRLFRAKTLENQMWIAAALRIVLFYLLLGAIWFQHWYLVWIIPFAAMLPDTPARRLTLWWSYIVTFQPLIYNYVSMRYTGWMDEPWRDLVPIVVFMGGAWLFVIGYWVWRASGRNRSIFKGARLVPKAEGSS